MADRRRVGLVVASNRGPLSLRPTAGGRIVAGHAAGGLAPNLARALGGADALWVAAALNDAERRAASEQVSVRTTGGVEVRLVEVSEQLLGAAYRVISNGTLWPLLHGLFDATYRPVLDRRWHTAWEGYRAYNLAFAEEIASVAEEGATVVVNDYHLLLCGAQLATMRPDLRTIHFSHTPFCGPEEIEVLPAETRRELLAGLCAYGTAAFHTRRWAAAFESCVQDAFGAETNTAVVPLGVDAPELARIADTDEVAKAREGIVAQLDGRRLIFRTDRVEPAKNIVRGFLAFEALLEDEPALLDEVVFSARLYSSRAELPEYIAYRNVIEQVCLRINERFASAKHPPIELTIADDLDASIAAMTVADVLFVNPIRDGMNLVAKEGAVLSRTSSVLGLSVRAGAFEELGEYALAIEPFDVAQTAQVLHQSLGLDERDRRARSVNLAAAAGRRPPAVWLHEVVERARRAEDRLR
jgi:trehalose 6-phosphate synthase